MNYFSFIRPSILTLIYIVTIAFLTATFIRLVLIAAKSPANGLQQIRIALMIIILTTLADTLFIASITLTSVDYEDAQQDLLLGTIFMLIKSFGAFSAYLWYSLYYRAKTLK
jgi:uncharacterized membrane protein